MLMLMLGVSAADDYDSMNINNHSVKERNDDIGGSDTELSLSQRTTKKRNHNIVVFFIDADLN